MLEGCKARFEKIEEDLMEQASEHVIKAMEYTTLERRVARLEGLRGLSYRYIRNLLLLLWLIILTSIGAVIYGKNFI
jgi:hypothetical protein